MSLIESQNEGESKKIRPVVLNVSKKILNRESVFRNIIDPQIEIDTNKNQSKLSDQQIKSSQLYTKLMSRIENLEKQGKMEAEDNVKNINILNKMISLSKEKIHQIKYQVWQIKNQIITLDEELQDQQELEEEYGDTYYDSGNIDSSMESYHQESDSEENPCSLKKMIHEQRDRSQQSIPSNSST